MFEFLIQHQIGALLLVLAVLSTAACAAHYKPHPGALTITVRLVPGHIQHYCARGLFGLCSFGTSGETTCA